MKHAGVDILVSMLPQDEAEDLGLALEASSCKAAGIHFRSFPITDRGTPSSTTSFAAFIEELRIDAQAGRAIAVHCFASIGRSSVLLASLMAAEGFSPDDAFRRLSAARGEQVPDTQEQARWVQHFAATHPGS